MKFNVQEIIHQICNKLSGNEPLLGMGQIQMIMMCTSERSNFEEEEKIH